MEKKSRVKKYEALRNEIESSYDIEQPKTTSEDVLRAFDETVFKKAVQSDDIDLKHAKKDDAQASLQNSFTNEYLDDFMREVREYNIQKGNRSVDSTELDILTKISSLPKRTNNIVTNVEEEYEPRPDDDFRTKKDIVKEVQALFEQTLKEDVDIVVEHFDLDDNEQMVEETYVASDADNEDDEDDLLMITETPQNISTNEIPKQKVVKKAKEPVKTSQQNELVEETKRLKKNLANYEAELNDLSNNVDKRTRFFNISLGVLIVILLVLIGFIVFSIYKAGGFGL